MIARLIKRFFQFLVIAIFFTIIYSNIIIIPKRGIGILKDKVDGYQKPILQSGYHWVWTMFVPGKYKLIQLNTSSQALNFSYKNKLKFTDYLNLSENYNVEISLRLRYKIQKKTIFQLLSKFNDNLNDITPFINKKLQYLMDSKFSEFYEKENDIPLLKKKFINYFLLKKNEKSTFEENWNSIFEKEKIILEQIELDKIYIPNYEIYKLQTNNVQQISQARRKALTNRIIAESINFKRKLKNKAEIDKSIKYSDLIRANPKLIDYLKIEKLNKKAKIIIVTDPHYSQSFINSNDSSNKSIKKNEEGYVAPIKPIER